MRIGHIKLANRLFAAPMAGVTDRPFRQLCKRLGAGYAVSEMVTSRKDLWTSLKTSRRADHEGETAPIAVQIAGTDAAMMAEAAAYNVDRGAQIIDINMGCPAKKVCNKWAGSALMKDETLALEIVEAVVAACAPHNVPVTLKMRTGWCASEKNAVRLARAAESAGIAMVAVHGRTREQGYTGEAEYDTVAAVKRALADPGRRQRRHRLAAEGARGVRRHRCRRDHDRPRRPGAAVDLPRDRPLPRDRRASAAAARRRRQGAGWSSTSTTTTGCYGEFAGVRSARKHIGWTLRGLPGGDAFRAEMNTIDSCEAQIKAVADWFDALADSAPLMPAAAARGGPRDPLTRQEDSRRDMASKKHIEECVRDSLEAYFRTCAASIRRRCTT